MAKRGISLLDLATPYPGAQALIPAGLATRLENLAVVSHRATTSAGAVTHSGVVAPLSDLGFPSLRSWDVEVPGLNTGLPFRLVRTRTPAGAGQNLEPGATSAFLDLVVDRIAITVPGLRPATLVPSAPGVTAHLVPDTARSKVRILGSGVVRIDLSGDGELVRFVDWPDPFDPAAPSGAVYRVSFDPVSFFVGGSEIGLTVDRLVVDASTEVTPPEIVARGQTPGWQGISIAEATLYLPDAPFVDRMTVGVKDVLLGSPAGLQGEIRVELGRTPVAPDAVRFLQQVGKAEVSRLANGSGRERTVPFVSNTPRTGRMRALLDPAVLGAATHPRMDWTLPDGRAVDAAVSGSDSGWFDASAGQHVTGRFSEEVDGTRVADAPTNYTFVPSEPTVTHAPKIDVHLGSTVIADVVSVSGTSKDLIRLQFVADAPPAETPALNWRYGAFGTARTVRGSTFVLASGEPCTSYVILADTQRRTRRVRVDILAEGSLLVGARDGVHGPTGALVGIRGVDTTWDLAAFHHDGFHTPATTRAELAATGVKVPVGGLAEVTLALGAGPAPEAPPPPVRVEEVRRLEVLFHYNDDGTKETIEFGRYAPRTQHSSVEASLKAWSKLFDTATTFLVIGRTCDISDNKINKTLATDRAAAVATWMYGRVESRGEQDALTPVIALLQEEVTGPTLTPREKAVGRLINLEYPDRSGWGDVAIAAVRQRFRRADVFAIGGNLVPPAGTTAAEAQKPTDTQTLDPALRRSYVPGADVTTIPVPPDRHPTLAWLVRLVVRWDSPTVTEWADAVPTQAEFTLERAGNHVVEVPVPGGGTAPVPVRKPSDPPAPAQPPTQPPAEPPTQPSTEILTLTGRWSHDSRSGQTVLSLSVASTGDPKGLYALDQRHLAIALALAPALLAGIGASGRSGAGVRVAALTLATVVLEAVAREGEVVLHSAEIEHRQRSLTNPTGFRTRILLDYTAALGLNFHTARLGSVSTAPDHPLKVRYKKVGLELDTAKSSWSEKFGLVFEDVSFEVADPGCWSIDGPLGDLIQVTAARAGSGSSWFELDLAFALDLGVVTLSGATVRCTFGDGGFSAELRGLAVAVDIPGVLRGQGRLVLGDGGALKAAVELELVSVGVTAQGALSFDPATDFLSVELGLVLPVGIPLSATGLGVFGFLGRFVSNGARALPSGFPNDPVGREIAWYRNTPAESKFAPQRGQWAVGLGMIVGTLPDQAFTFNATGMFVVAFPDPSVVFGIDAKLVRKPAATPSTQGPPASSSLSVLGLVAVDDEAVMVGVRGCYTIPKVLDLRMPVDGYFPYPSTPGDAYVRIGSDGVVAEGRPGDPVTVTLLPGTLGVSARAYLMVEERKLHRLGDDPAFSFDGFAIGFGAGWRIRWSAGPIRLDAAARILVGFGTNPFLLKGGILVEGELNLRVVKVSASGSVVATVWDDGDVRVNLAGKFCGSVSCFFFSLKGCVGIEIGSPLTPTAPPPPPPIGKVSLTDRRGATTAVATAAAPGPEQTVWPDTVPVIEFTHHLQVALGGGAFAPGAGPAGPVWSGTSEMKYAYRLTGVEIVPDGGAALGGPLDSAWWLPTSRPGVLADGDVAVSESEGCYLALLSWDPAPWTYWLADGGAGTDADPSDTPGRVCDPPPRPARVCAAGKAGVRTGPDAVELRTQDPGTPPFPCRFAWPARERAFASPLADVVPLITAQGLALTPGGVGPAPFGEDVWWLANLTRCSFTAQTTELAGPLAPEVGEAELLLVVCTDRRRRPPAGPKRTCAAVADHFEAGKDLGPSAFVGPVKAEAHGPMHTAAGVDGAPTTLRYPDEGVTFLLPETAGEVSVTVQPLGAKVVVQALDGAGTVVAARTVPQGRHPVEAVLPGAGVTRVDLLGGAGEAGVVRICWGPAGATADDGSATGATTGALPVVLGSGEGTEVEWVPTVENRIENELGVCSLVRYGPPEATTAWSGLRIRAWAGTGRDDAGRVGVASLCGVSASAAGQAAANARFAAHLRATVNGRAQAAVPARRNLLERDRGYTITVRWEWQGWVRSDGEPAPPATPAASGWTAGSAQSYRFRTAAAAATTGAPPAELTDEHDFDPRALLRYLIAFEPDTRSAPHLLADPLRVHLAVDHADRLAGLYGRELGLRLRRTDPPPGTLAGQAHPANEPIAVAWGPLHDAHRPVGQRRLLEAIREAPCLDEPPLGGTTGEVTADLVPGAWYDLMLTATPAGSPDAEDVVVSRAHFQASRHRDAAGLLAALGFSPDGDPDPFVAPDAVVTAPLRPGDLVVGDAALDAALAGVGLDPWPLSDRARTSVLWLLDAATGTWRVAGLLLEAPEPIVRTGRTSLEVTACTYGAIRLTPRRRNLAGTRVLLAPPAPSVPSGAETCSVTLTRTVTDRTGATTPTAVTGRRFALDVPRSVRMEAGT